MKNMLCSLVILGLCATTYALLQQVALNGHQQHGDAKRVAIIGQYIHYRSEWRYPTIIHTHTDELSQVLDLLDHQPHTISLTLLRPTISR